MIRLIVGLMLAVPPQAPPIVPAPPQAPPVVAVLAPTRSPLDDVKAPPFHGIGKHVMPPEAPVRPPVIRPAKKLPAGPLHSHRCPYDGYVWAHGHDSFGNAADHTCPKCGRELPRPWPVYQRNVARPVQAPAPDPGGWVYPQSVTTGVCPPGHL
jgi:hypothetical protein